MNTLVDNDVLIKGSCYGLLCELILGVSPLNTVGVLGSARFVVPERIRRCRLRANHASAVHIFLDFLTHTSVIEPTTEEQQMAADLELAAQQVGLSLDSGESQLCAVASMRLLPLLLTGDKRAIAAIDKLFNGDSRLHSVAGKVMCLEQLFVALLSSNGGGLRNTVCAEPEVDKALSNCFSCFGGVVSIESHLEGLNSYIQNLRGLAARVLRN